MLLIQIVTCALDELTEFVVIAMVIARILFGLLISTSASSQESCMKLSTALAILLGLLLARWWAKEYCYMVNDLHRSTS